jgi:hypothetical protein
VSRTETITKTKGKRGIATQTEIAPFRVGTRVIHESGSRGILLRVPEDDPGVAEVLSYLLILFFRQGPVHSSRELTNGFDLSLKFFNLSSGFFA